MGELIMYVCCILRYLYIENVYVVSIRGSVFIYSYCVLCFPYSSSLSSSAYIFYYMTLSFESEVKTHRSPALCSKQKVKGEF